MIGVRRDGCGCVWGAAGRSGKKRGGEVFVLLKKEGLELASAWRPMLTS